MKMLFGNWRQFCLSLNVLSNNASCHPSMTSLRPLEMQCSSFNPTGYELPNEIDYEV